MVIEIFYVHKLSTYASGDLVGEDILLVDDISESILRLCKTDNSAM